MAIYADGSGGSLDAELVSQEAELKAMVANAKSGEEVQPLIALARFLAEMGFGPGATDRSLEAQRMFEAALAVHSSMPVESLSSRQRSELARCRAWFGVFLEDTKQFEDAEREYRACLELEPSHALALGNLAHFVHKVRRDRAQAMELFEKAVRAHPSHVAILVKFAGVKKACGDLDGAEELYEQAVRVAGPEDGDSRGAYAVFLHAARKDASRAEAMYAAAATADPLHANNLSNFGLFLSDVKGDVSGSEKLYLQALEADPSHANALYNYAVLLDSSLGRTLEAQHMYRRVLTCDQKHAFALYNLAVLLEEGLPKTGTLASSSTANSRPQMPPVAPDPSVPPPSSSSAATTTTNAASAPPPSGGSGGGGGDGGVGVSVAGGGGMEEVKQLYDRAVKAAPRDSVSAADLGRFLLVRLKDPFGAAPHLKRALELDPHCAVALYNTGLLHADNTTVSAPTSTSSAAAASAAGGWRGGSTTSSEDSCGGSGGGTARAENSGGSSSSGSFPRDSMIALRAWRNLVEKVDPGHVNGLRRLARLEATLAAASGSSDGIQQQQQQQKHRSPQPDFKQADERYVQAINAALESENGSGASSSSSSSRCGGGSRGSAEECLAVAGEALSVMAAAPAACNKARALAEKVRKRFGR
jgi:tetratricopeptide (TPR) repeat protein